MLRHLLKRLLPENSTKASSQAWPVSLQAYMQKQRKPSKRMAVSDLRFVVFDSETTGLDFATNRLLSIAGVAMTGLDVDVSDSFEVIVEQPDVGGAGAAVIHGMIRHDLEGGIAEDEAASRFLEFAADAVLVAHHAVFDIRMLQKAIAKHRGATVWNASIDTAKLAQRVDVSPMSSTASQGRAYQLDALVERYGIDVPERHTAAGDALATAFLLQRLLRAAERRGIQTLGDLLAR